jgi:hypothetical protein
VSDVRTVDALLGPKIVKLSAERSDDVGLPSIQLQKAAKGARESGWRSPFALLLVHSRLFKSLSVAGRLSPAEPHAAQTDQRQGHPHYQ